MSRSISHNSIVIYANSSNDIHQDAYHPCGEWMSALLAAAGWFFLYLLLPLPSPPMCFVLARNLFYLCLMNTNEVIMIWNTSVFMILLQYCLWKVVVFGLTLGGGGDSGWCLCNCCRYCWLFLLSLLCSLFVLSCKERHFDGNYERVRFFKDFPCAICEYVLLRVCEFLHQQCAMIEHII